MDTKYWLPEEAENEKFYNEFLRNDLMFLRELLTIGLECSTAFCQSPTEDSQTRIKTLVGGILVREIRRLRLLTIAYEKGFPENASILTRSLFEGLLGERFLLREPIADERCSDKLLKARNNLPSIPDSFSRKDFHSYLYAALPSVNRERTRSLIVLNEAETKNADEEINEIKQVIGQKWFNILKNKNYSGLTIKQLSENYEMSDYYEKVYGIQSSSVHASDALQFIEIDHSTDSSEISLMFCLKPKTLHNVPEAMRLAGGLSGQLFQDITEYFKLDLKNKLLNFRNRYASHVNSTK
ncbi:MAG: DUF5677 domain-containing protein [Planctomycetaceae bacterium]